MVVNRITLAPQCRRFVADEHNQTLIKFLLYYFNSCPLAESVYPNRNARKIFGDKAFVKK